MNVSKPRYENYIEQDFRMIIKIKLLFRCHEKYVEKNTNLERWRQLEGGDMIINIIRGNKFKLSVIRMINVVDGLWIGVNELHEGCDLGCINWFEIHCLQ